jgi:hypothetical protein
LGCVRARSEARFELRHASIVAHRLGAHRGAAERIDRVPRLC